MVQHQAQPADGTSKTALKAAKSVKHIVLPLIAAG